MDRDFVILVVKAIKKLRSGQTPDSIIHLRDVGDVLSDLNVKFSGPDLRNAVLFLQQQGCFSTTDAGSLSTGINWVTDNFQIGQFNEAVMKRWTS